jgi:hypothetical protein
MHPLEKKTVALGTTIPKSPRDLFIFLVPQQSARQEDNRDTRGKQADFSQPESVE